MSSNVYSKPLIACSLDPLTGYYRTGCCETCADDTGMHTVCARMTKEFLEFTRSNGNDLVTPRPEHGFPGLKPGDYWCLCLIRWLEALQVGIAPPLKLEATHASVLEFVEIEILERHAIKD